MNSQRDDPVRISGVTERLTSTGRVSGYQIEVWHDGLNEHRVLSDRDLGVLQNKLDVHLSRWDEKYEKRLEREAREAQRQSGLETAEVETEEAQAALQACRDILQHTLGVDDRVDWEGGRRLEAQLRAVEGRGRSSNRRARRDRVECI